MNRIYTISIRKMEFRHGYIPIRPVFKCNMTSVIVCNLAHQFNAHQQDVYLQTDTFRNAMQHFRYKANWHCEKWEVDILHDVEMHLYTCHIASQMLEFHFGSYCILTHGRRRSRFVYDER